MAGTQSEGVGTGSADAVTIAHQVEEAVARTYAQEGRSPLSPEARREQSVRTDAAVRRAGAIARSYSRIAPGTRPFAVARRVIVGTYYDGFIHAGNLAYLSLIALFPFFITATAVMSIVGMSPETWQVVSGVLATLPPNVAATLEGPVQEALTARTGPLLWLGALVGIWTVGSLIETIRDILRRAYGTRARRSFFHYRLYSIGLTIGAVVLMIAAFSMQVAIVAIEELIVQFLPRQFAVYGDLAFTRGVTIAILFLSIFLLFISLTPQDYHGRRYPKWPGALVTTLWWVGVTVLLPPLLVGLLSYNLTYGSLAGVMISLLFFYFIGLGVVIGAELNAALAEAPMEKRDTIGQSDNRTRKNATVGQEAQE